MTVFMNLGEGVKCEWWRGWTNVGNRGGGSGINRTSTPNAKYCAFRRQPPPQRSDCIARPKRTNILFCVDLTVCERGVGVGGDEVGQWGPKRQFLVRHLWWMPLNVSSISKMSGQIWEEGHNQCGRPWWGAYAGRSQTNHILRFEAVFVLMDPYTRCDVFTMNQSPSR